MPHYDVAHWVGFFGAALLLNLAPGPDLAFILGQTARSGKRSGMAAMFGIWVGVLCHITFAAVGLSALIAASAKAFMAVKLAGVAYLFWLGFQALRSRGNFQAGSNPHMSVSRRRVFVQGILINLLNPKVAIFFLAFLPQFVVAGAGAVWLQLLIHGVLIIAVAAMIEPPLVILGDRITARIRASDRLSAWLERALGGMLIALGVKLALMRR